MRVERPDLEVWATRFLRAELRALGWDVEVDSKEPADLEFPLERPLIVVRDDSGQMLSPVSFDAALGVSVLAGSRQDDGLARRLSRLVFSILTDGDLPIVEGSPVAAVNPEGCRGPYSIDDSQDVARRYMAVEWTVVGSW